MTVNDAGWACEDCTVLMANGDAPADLTAEELADYLTRVDRHTAGLTVIVGGPHTDDCARGECDCGYDAFSTAPCDVCGIHLHGSRFVVTFFRAAS